MIYSTGAGKFPDCDLIIDLYTRTVDDLLSDMFDQRLEDLDFKYIDITKVQEAMIKSLGQVFGREISDLKAKGILLSKLESFAGGNSLGEVDSIPIFEDILDRAQGPRITKDIGWSLVEEFSRLN